MIRKTVIRYVILSVLAAAALAYVLVKLDIAYHAPAGQPPATDKETAP